MSTPTDPAASVAPRNPPGRAALWVAIVLVVLGLVQQVVGSLIPLILSRQGLSVSASSVILIPGSVVIALLAIAAVVLGIIGLQRPSSPRAAAAAGLVLGAHALLVLVASLAVTLVLPLL